MSIDLPQMTGVELAEFARRAATPTILNFHLSVLGIPVQHTPFFRKGQIVLLKDRIVHNCTVDEVVWTISGYDDIPLDTDFRP